MLDSAHHHAPQAPARTTPLLLAPSSTSSRGVKIMAPAQTGSAHKAALSSTRALDERALRSVKNCCQAVHDIALMAPSHTIYECHEDHLLQLASDLHTLGQWVQTSLLAFRATRRAASEVPAQPPPAPAPAPASAPTPAPAAPLPTRATAYPTPSPPPEEPSTSSKVGKAVMTARTPHPTPNRPPRGTIHTRAPRPPDAAPCVTLRYIGTLRNRKLPHPRYLIDKLKVISEISIAAISYTRDCQLVIYPKAPCTVQDLINKRCSLTSLLQGLLGPADKADPAYDTGSAWTKLVIHRVPLPVYKPSFGGRWRPSSPPPRLPFNCHLGDLAHDICKTNNIHRDSIHDVRPLCALESRDQLFLSSADDAPQYCSFMICLANSDAAARFLKHGAFIQGALCRVTPYRPRRSTRRPTSPGS